MRGSRNFARGVHQARLPENSSDVVFLVVNLFYTFTVVYQWQWFISKKAISFKGFRGGPTQHLSGGGGGWGGVQHFPGGSEGGSKC